MNDSDIDSIKYALTLRAAAYPDLSQAVTQLCGCQPARNADMQAHFGACGHDKLLPFWSGLIASDSTAQALAAQTLADYQIHMAKLNAEFDADPALPSLGTMLTNAAGAVVRDLKAGRPRRTAEESSAIRAICAACEFLRASDQRCSQCGCWIKAKSTWKQEHCPVKKW